MRQLGHQMCRSPPEVTQLGCWFTTWICLTPGPKPVTLRLHCLPGTVTPVPLLSRVGAVRCVRRSERALSTTQWSHGGIEAFPKGKQKKGLGWGALRLERGKTATSQGGLNLIFIFERESVHMSKGQRETEKI